MSEHPEHHTVAQVNMVGDTVAISGPDVEITLRNLSVDARRSWALRLLDPVQVRVDVPDWLKVVNPHQAQSLQTPALPREELQELLFRHPAPQAPSSPHQTAREHWFRQLHPSQQAAVIRQRTKRHRLRSGFEFLFPYLSPEQLTAFIIDGALPDDQDQGGKPNA